MRYRIYVIPNYQKHKVEGVLAVAIYYTPLKKCHNLDIPIEKKMRSMTT
jgi:hypothetical protein